MNTSIVAVIKRQYFVFEAWTVENPDDKRNQWILNKNIERLSLNRPDVSLWYYVVTKDKLNKGDNFSIIDYDRIVQKCQHCINPRQREWKSVSQYELMIAAKIAKKDLGF